MAEKLTLEVAYWKGNTRVVQYSPSVSNLQGQLLSQASFFAFALAEAVTL